MATVKFTVSVVPQTNEVVGIVGSAPELGDWMLDGAVILNLDAETAEWTTEVKFEGITTVKYRYFLGVLVGQEKKIIVRKWEIGNGNAIRKIELIKAKAQEINDIEFGVVNDKIISDQGWLTEQTEVRFNISRQGIKPIINFHENVGNVEVNNIKISFETDNDIQVKTNVLKAYEYAELERNIAVKLPQEEEEMLTFTAEIIDLSNFSGQFVINDERDNKLGCATIVGDMLIESIGLLTLALMNEKNVSIGSLRMEYVVIKPYKSAEMTMEKSFCAYWRKREMLNIGHRGSGNSFTAATPSDLYENTISSFKAAASHKADMIEFDVQLTKDKMPIVFHDFTICTVVKTKTGGQKMAMHEVEVQSLSYDELQTYTARHRFRKTSLLEPKFQEDSIDSNLKPFPKLRELFVNLPENVGFDIELKWPHYFKDETWYHDVKDLGDANDFIDRIFDVVFECAGDRRLIFSCFEANICTLLRRKQNRYPVIYISVGQLDPDPFMEVRSRLNSLAIAFAASEKFLGVCINENEVYGDSNLVDRVHEAKLLFFLYGDNLASSKNRELLKKQGIDGVIFDRIHQELSEGPNIFQNEKTTQSNGI